MATIFLSHASVDDALASTLERWLGANGFDDLFVDHSTIRTGDKWPEELRRAKASCRVVVCLVTPAWLRSDECYAEFRAAWIMGRRIMALFCLGDATLDDVQRARLNHIKKEDQGADITRAGAPAALDLDAASAVSVAAPFKAGLLAGGALAKVGLDPRAFTTDRARRPEPFPGLASFGDEDADAAIFYGRDPEITRCLEDLREMRATPAALAYGILGASGSGKSSLMKAGLLPRLRRERGWFVVHAFRPGEDALVNFAEALATTAGDWGDTRSPGAIRDTLRTGWHEKGDLLGILDAIIAPLKSRADRPGATVLIALDQGEELARAGGESGDSADAVAAYLTAAAEAKAQEGEPSAYVVAMTVRSDSFEEVQAAPRLEGLAIRPADIRALPVYRFVDAIEKPAARYDIEIEPALIDALIEDAGGKDALPLLAFTLQRLWKQYKSERRIVRANYESIGKLSGLIDGAAERALRGVDPLAPQRPLEGKLGPGSAPDKAAARVFLPGLAQLSERGSPIRRVAKLTDFDDAGRALLSWFERWRLVVTTGDVVEVAHEAMFREWRRFSRWLEPERARLEALRSLQSAAAAWSAKGRRNDDLVHRGASLASARALEGFPDYQAQLDGDATARSYLAAAGATEQRRRSLVGAGSAALILVLIAGVAWSDTQAWRARLSAYAEGLAGQGRALDAAPFAIAGVSSPSDYIGAQSDRADAVLARVATARIRSDLGPLSSYQLAGSGAALLLQGPNNHWTFVDLSKGGARTDLGDLGPVLNALVSSNGRTLVTQSLDFHATVYDLTRARRPIDLGALQDTFGFALSSDGNVLVTQGLQDYRGSLYDLERGARTDLGPLQSFALSASGKTLVTEGQDQRGTLYDLARGGARTDLGDLGALQSFALSADGRTLVTEGQDQHATLYDLTRGGARTGLGGVQQFVFSADGATLATLGQDDHWRLYDLSPGGRNADLGALRQLGLSVDGKILLEQAENGRWTLVDLRHAGARTDLGDLGDLQSFVLSRAGERLVTLGADRRGTLVDLSHGAATTDLGALVSFALSDDGKSLVTQGQDQRGTLYDLDHLAWTGAGTYPRGAALSAWVCEASGPAVRPLPSALRAWSASATSARGASPSDQRLFESLRGHPWNPCDWRGLAAGPEGWAQFGRSLLVRIFGERVDYNCGEVSAFGTTGESRVESCRYGGGS